MIIILLITCLWNYFSNINRQYIRILSDITYKDIIKKLEKLMTDEIRVNKINKIIIIIIGILIIHHCISSDIEYLQKGHLDIRVI